MVKYYHKLLLIVYCEKSGVGILIVPELQDVDIMIIISIISIIMNIIILLFFVNYFCLYH